MRKVFLSPGKFIIGKNELNNLGEHVASFGKRALLIAHPDDSARVQRILDETCKNFDVVIENAGFGGECTYAEVDRLGAYLEGKQIGCVIGLGGGKAIDTAKCLSDKRTLPMICVPTIVSTDAPCSSMAVMYDETHAYAGNYYLKRSPAVVLIDSQIIADAPLRFLIAGIGDAYATFFEAEVCVRTNAKNYGGGSSTLAAFELARLCHKTLVENAEKAILACRQHAVIPALENIIEANTLLSGLGFESVGLAAAHCIPTVLFELGATEAMHGELVAFSLLVQFVLENRPMEQIRETIDFYRRVGLPLHLKDVGITGEIPEQVWESASRFATTPTSTMRNMPITVTNDIVKPAILCADRLAD
ncbi:MAG: glycerol dehydrogenase [Bacillota bacterium]